MAEFEPQWPLQQTSCPVCDWPAEDDDVDGDTAMALKVVEHIRESGDDENAHDDLLADLPNY